MWDIVGALLLLIGAFFVLVAAFGLLRLPDVLSRMQATSKATTLGLSAIMVAVALHAGSLETTFRVVLIILFTFLTAPIGAHMLARAAYRTAAGGWRNLAVDQLGTAGEQAARMVRLAEGVPATEPPHARMLVCRAAHEDEARLVTDARLDRFFNAPDVDTLDPPDGEARHHITAWVQIAVDRLTIGDYALLLLGEPAGRPGLSPATQRLIRRAPAGIWMAPADRRQSDGPVLLPVEAPGAHRGDRLAIEMLHAVARLARTTGRPLHVVHAFGSTAAGDDAQLVDAERERRRAAMTDLIGRAGLEGVPEVVHIEPGDPRDAIPAVATRTGAWLLVVRTRGRGWPLAAHLRPTIAEDVVSRVTCAALILRTGADLAWGEFRGGGPEPGDAASARAAT